jgi:integrase
MKLMAYTFVRTSELIGAKWGEFDLKGSLWVVPAERMKKVKGRLAAPHLVALSRQSKSILKELHKLTGGGEFVLPHWLGNEEFHLSHRSNLLRKDFDYYSKHGWTDNPEDPYVWMDDKGLWYKQIAGTKERIYFEYRNEFELH